MKTADQHTDWQMIRQLFLTFLKIGPMSFGGGFSMIPFIQREVVEKRKWLETRDMADVFAISQSVPGAVAVNSAILIGYRIGGLIGGFAALLGILLPTFFIMLLLSMFFLYVQEQAYVQAAMKGIGPAVVALITHAAFQVGKTSIIDKLTCGLMIAATAGLYFLQAHPVLIIIAGAAFGIILVRIRDQMGLTTNLEKQEQYYKYDDYYIGDGI